MTNRIMVVDDDSSILELLRTLLEGEGYQVQAYHSGASALAGARDHPPDAAIIDLMMPEMNGLELIHALKYDPRTHKIPILICSAYYGDLRQVTAQLRKNGDTSSLRKPFQIQELLELVARLVNGTKHRRRRPTREGEPDLTAAATAPARVTPLAASAQARASSRGSAARSEEPSSSTA